MYVSAHDVLSRSLVRFKFSLLVIAFVSLLLSSMGQAQTFSSPAGGISITQGSGTTLPSSYPSSSSSCTSTTPKNPACIYVSGLLGSYTSMSVTLTYSSLDLYQSFADP